MPSATKGKLEYESSRTLYPMGALTDSGDATTFTSSATLFSRYDGAEPDVRPNGVISGCEVTPHATDNDKVNVAAGKVNIAGVEVTVTAGTVTITRDGSNGYLITSITVNNTPTLGSTAGTANASAHSETRAASGGPPLLATTVVELGQVRTTSTTAAKILASEIKTTLNVHREAANFPTWSEEDSDAQIKFSTALMANHTGPVPKAVHAEYSDPSFSEQIDAVDFVPVEQSNSQNSTSVYNGTVGSTSTSLNQGSFSFFPREGLGVTDALIAEANKRLWFKFFPNRSGSRFVRGNAILGITRAFPADDNVSVACTLSGDKAFTSHAS